MVGGRPGLLREENAPRGKHLPASQGANSPGLLKSLRGFAVQPEMQTPSCRHVIRSLRRLLFLL